MSCAKPWDSHVENVTAHPQNGPVYDITVAALQEDLANRGLLENTLVIIGGEVGRTPRINDKAGRDHWASCYTTVLAGGGVKPGIILGSIDALAELPKDRPIFQQAIMATMYHLLVVYYTKIYINEPTRPVQLEQNGKPISESFSAFTLWTRCM